MANLDTYNKRRSVTGIMGLFTILPIADGTIGKQDRVHLATYYSGIEISDNAIFGLIEITFTHFKPFKVVKFEGIDPLEIDIEGIKPLEITLTAGE